MAQEVMPELKDYITWGLTILCVVVIPFLIWYHQRIVKAIQDAKKAIETAESIKQDVKEMADDVSASSDKVNSRIDGLMATLMSKRND